MARKKKYVNEDLDVIEDLFGVDHDDMLDSVDCSTLICSDEDLTSLLDEIDIDVEVNEQMSVNDDDIKDDAIRQGKKKIKRPIGEIVNSFISTRSDKDWKDLQTYYWWGLHSFAYKFTQNMDDAYDLTIETFMQAYDVISLYDPSKGQFSTWLWTLCRNKCLTHIHRKNKLDIINNDISDIYESELFNHSYAVHDLELLDYKVNDKGEIEPIDIGNADVELYNISLDEIRNFKPDLRDILWLRFVEGLKLQEISERLGIDISNVKNKYYKARANLARILKVNHKEDYERYLECSHEKDVMSF